LKQYFTGEGQRVFGIAVEGDLSFPSVDLVQLGGGVNNKAFTLDVDAGVTDGYLSLSFMLNDPTIDQPSKFIFPCLC